MLRRIPALSLSRLPSMCLSILSRMVSTTHSLDLGRIFNWQNIVNNIVSFTHLALSVLFCCLILIETIWREKLRSSHVSQAYVSNWQRSLTVKRKRLVTDKKLTKLSQNETWWGRLWNHLSLFWYTHTVEIVVGYTVTSTNLPQPWAMLSFVLAKKGYRFVEHVIVIATIHHGTPLFFWGGGFSHNWIQLSFKQHTAGMTVE